MNILHFITSLREGGAEHLLVNFIKYYKNHNKSHEHYLIILTDKRDLQEKIKDSIKELRCLYYTNSIYGMYVASKKLRSFIKKWHIDLVHAHLAYPIIISRFARIKDQPLVFTYHNMEHCIESPNFSWKMVLLDLLTYPKSNARSIFVSSEVKKCVGKWNSRIVNGVVIPNFAAEYFYPLYSFDKDNGLKLIAVGGLKKIKNHQLLIEGIKRRKGKNISLDIYGEGSCRDKLQAEIECSNLPIRLMGNQFINSTLLASYDAFVMPSFSEGMPISLIEAMRTGLPSLLSDLPQLKNIAKDSAFYFNPSSIEDFVRVLDDVYQQSAKFKQMSLQAIKYSEQFSVKNYVASVCQVYNSF